MRIDLHVHTRRFSGCSNIDPLLLLVKARCVGLDGIALTEQGIRWPDEKIARLKAEAGAADLVVIAGQEVACYSRCGRFQGEFLAFGYPRSLGSNKSVEEVADRVHAREGVLIAAHPFKRDRRGEGYYGRGADVRHFPIDGIEVAHPDYCAEDRRAARQTAAAAGLVGTGGSDAHDLGRIGRCLTVFDDPIDGEAALCEAIRRRRVRPEEGRGERPPLINGATGERS